MSNTRNFQFFNPLPHTVQGITPNFPLGGGNIDYTSIKKNIPHFIEIAEKFGLNKLKGQILKRTFNIVENKQIINQNNFNFKDSQDHADDVLPSIGTSVFGFPIFSNLIIRAGTYQNNQGVTIGEYPEIRLDAVIMEVSKESNRIITDIQGRDRSVIEYLSRKSKVINVKGRLMSNTRGAYPYEAVQDLSYAMDSNKSLQVDSWFLQMLGIYFISPGKFHTPQTEGGIEFQLFEFDAIEDSPVILKMKNQ